MSENGRPNYLSTGKPDANGVAAAKRALEDAMRPGPMGDLLEAITGLVAVTAPPPELDMEHLGAWSNEISAALMDYPGDVAVRALKEWRKTKQGEWWPREKPLRDLCETMMATRRLLLAAVNMQDHAAKEAPRGRYMTPFGRTQIFYEAAAKTWGAEWANAWMRGGVNVQFDEGTVYATGAGAMMIREKCSRLLANSGVALVACPQVSALLAKYVETLPPSAQQKRKRYGDGGGRYPD